MLRKPDADWVDFKIHENTYQLSYLTNVPFDWVDQAIHGLTTMLPFTVHGFCEPGRVLCTVSYQNCYVVKSNDEGLPDDSDTVRVECRTMNMVDFCEQLHRDITENIDEWSAWYPFFEAETPEEEENTLHKENKASLQKRLDQLRLLIDEKKEYFGGGFAFF